MIGLLRLHFVTFNYMYIVQYLVEKGKGGMQRSLVSGRVCKLYASINTDMIMIFYLLRVVTLYIRTDM